MLTALCTILLILIYMFFFDQVSKNASIYNKIDYRFLEIERRLKPERLEERLYVMIAESAANNDEVSVYLADYLLEMKTENGEPDRKLLFVLSSLYYQFSRIRHSKGLSRKGILGFFSKTYNYLVGVLYLTKALIFSKQLEKLVAKNNESLTVEEVSVRTHILVTCGFFWKALRVIEESMEQISRRFEDNCKSFALLFKNEVEILIEMNADYAEIHSACNRALEEAKGSNDIDLMIQTFSFVADVERRYGAVENSERILSEVSSLTKAG